MLLSSPQFTVIYKQGKLLVSQSHLPFGHQWSQAANFSTCPSFMLSVACRSNYFPMSFSSITFSFGQQSVRDLIKCSFCSAKNNIEINLPIHYFSHLWNKECIWSPHCWGKYSGKTSSKENLLTRWKTW